MSVGSKPEQKGSFRGIADDPWLFCCQVEGCRGVDGDALKHAGAHVYRAFFHLHLVLRERACLVQYDDLCLAGLLERDGGLEENAVFRAEAAADHDRNGRRQTERAGTGDDQHRDAPREGVAECFSEQQPDDKGQSRDRDHRRDEHAGDAVRELRDRRLGGRRIADHFDDLREGGVLAHARGLTANKAGLIDRRGRHAVSRGLVHGDALAGQRGFVDRARSVEHQTVHGDTLARAYEKDVAARDLVDRNGHLRPAAFNAGGLRREAHQGPQRVRGLSLRAGLKHLADGDEREDHRRGFEVQIVHQRMCALAVAVLDGGSHQEKNNDAVGERHAGAERDERVHVRRAAHKAAEAADEELAVDEHDDGSEQQLQQTDRHMVAFKKSRQWKAPHRMPH